MVQAYPDPDDWPKDDRAEQEIEWLMACVSGVRKIRSSMNIAPGRRLPLLLKHGTTEDATLLRAHKQLLLHLARLESIEWRNEDEETPESSTAIVGEMRLLIPLSGLIDKDEEITRLNREIDRIQKGMAGSEKKLSNPNYTARAPEAVVSKEREKLAEMRTTLAGLQAQLSRIEQL